MNQFLLRRLAAKPAPRSRQIVIGVAAGAVAMAARLAMTPALGGAMPFLLFYPMVAFGSVFGGAFGGAACVVTTLIASQILWLISPASVPIPGNGLPALLYVASASFVIWLVWLLRLALSEVRSLSEHQRVLMLELQHRVKNSLAMVQAVAHQTLGAEHRQARDALMERYQALAAAHDLLVTTAWEPAPIRTLVEDQLKPFASLDRFELRGEDERAPAKAVATLALCLHELATNATKHGALSAPEGRVEVRWERVDPGRLRLSWIERGGPAAATPRRLGFGARLLKGSASGPDGAGPELEFRPEGVRWVGEFQF